MSEVILTMPAVALRGVVILPGTIVHFDISRDRSLKAVQTAMQGDQQIFLIAQRDMEKEDPEITDLYEIGVIAAVKQVIKLQNNIVRILVEGTQRAQLFRFTGREEFLEAEIVCLEDTGDGEIPELTRAAMAESIQETFGKYAALKGKASKEVQPKVNGIQDLGKLIDYIGNHLPVPQDQKQKILETVNLTDRYEEMLSLLFRQMEIIGIKNEFQEKVKEKVDRHQKEYLLREQMAVIREELGENHLDTEIEEFRNKLEGIQAPAEVKDVIKKEINRLQNMGQNLSESAVSRGYIEVLLDIPWERTDVENTDLDHAEEILNRDHYGLEKVKERVLEFLAVRHLTSKGDSPIVCLVGPPGTGKTSIARSIAEALNKKYVRICLGGVRDEAEIRGHRRTYIGAMPGRIIQGLRSAGVKNPLMLLDEVDKVSSDYKGDTSAALLEVLDSEQNAKFRDHYVDMPVDLSEVLFLATANNASDIPKPLLDRMEIIEVSSYTENEKFHIAKEHLFSKQLSKNGLIPEQLTLEDDALQRIIRSYTREAGVRGLERRLGEICRKTARQIYGDSMGYVHISGKNLENYLGKELFEQDRKNPEDEVGIVRGLAWTSVGGVTLEVEVNVMPGKGEILLTGKLGDVMKESARAGISYIRSVGGQYHIEPDYFEKHDVHIHIPEGAVPKDGPSAGITMATAILSAVTGRKVRSDLAMTGEITLRGRILPIGGLKEKLLAAKNAGMGAVCIPKKNEKDLAEISEEITEGMRIIPVERMEQVIDEAFAE